MDYIKSLMYAVIGAEILNMIIPYAAAVIFLILTIYTVVKKEPRNKKWEFVAKVFTIAAVFEMIVSNLSSNTSSHADEILLLSCSLFEIVQSLFNKNQNLKINKLSMVLNILIIISCVVVIVWL